MADSNLGSERCEPCHGGTPALTRPEAEALLAQISDRWQISDDAQTLAREIVFKDFAQAMAFLNRLAEVAESEGHHPDFYLHGWNNVRVTLSTHAIGGLSRNDFLVAAKLDRVVSLPLAPAR